MYYVYKILAYIYCMLNFFIIFEESGRIIIKYYSFSIPFVHTLYNNKEAVEQKSTTTNLYMVYV